MQGFSMVSFVLAAMLSGSQAAPVSTEAQSSGAPSLEVAAERGPQIFNSVFDSLRNYGSTLHPNGMSFIMATIPEGVLLHHGSLKNATPTTFDWLAFEIEHAEVFARPWRRRRPHRNVDNSLLPDQILFGPASFAGDNYEEEEHGWLHTYRTVEPLRLLYLDGMSGNKDDTGVIDTQDYILRASSQAEGDGGDGDDDDDDDDDEPFLDNDEDLPPLPLDEAARVRDICKLCAKWQLHGVIRTETPGSEVIKCNFGEGLEEVQSLQRKDPSWTLSATGHGGPGRDRGEKPGEGMPYNFESGFRDLGAGRVLLDYSTMVSAYSFPVNVTNPDTHPVERDLPRLVETTPEQRLSIKDYVAKQVTGNFSSSPPPSGPGHNWRDVADLIVRRYAQRIASIADTTQTKTVPSLLESIQFLINVFVDYSIEDPEVREASARQRCSHFYLQTKSVQTESDEMLYAAFKATNEQICTALFDNAKLLVDDDVRASEAVVDWVKGSFQRLVEKLNWSVFEKRYA